MRYFDEESFKQSKVGDMLRNESKSEFEQLKDDFFSQLKLWSGTNMNSISSLEM